MRLLSQKQFRFHQQNYYKQFLLQEEREMPLFEFICSDCSHKFETLILDTAMPNNICPKCGSCNTEKQLSSFSTTSNHIKSACPAYSCCPSRQNKDKCSNGYCCH
jgi:putative FmdB family regulatory protein